MMASVLDGCGGWQRARCDLRVDVGVGGRSELWSRHDWRLRRKKRSSGTQTCCVRRNPPSSSSGEAPGGGGCDVDQRRPHPTAPHPTLRWRARLVRSPPLDAETAMLMGQNEPSMYADVNPDDVCCSAMARAANECADYSLSCGCVSGWLRGGGSADGTVHVHASCAQPDEPARAAAAHRLLAPEAAMESRGLCEEEGGATPLLSPLPSTR